MLFRLAATALIDLFPASIAHAKKTKQANAKKEYSRGLGNRRVIFNNIATLRNREIPEVIPGPARPHQNVILTALVIGFSVNGIPVRVAEGFTGYPFPSTARLAEVRIAGVLETP